MRKKRNSLLLTTKRDHTGREKRKNQRGKNSLRGKRKENRGPRRTGGGGYNHSLQPASL